MCDGGQHDRLRLIRFLTHVTFSSQERPLLCQYMSARCVKQHCQRTICQWQCIQFKLFIQNKHPNSVATLNTSLSQNHWCLVVIDMDIKTIMYYDSMDTTATTGRTCKRKLLWYVISNLPTGMSQEHNWNDGCKSKQYHTLDISLAATFNKSTLASTVHLCQTDGT